MRSGAAALIFLLDLAACARYAATPADVIILHGRVYTVDAARPWAQAVVVRGERIVAVGSDGEARAYQGAHTRVIDAHGRLVLPGFIDSHIHFLQGALDLDHLHLEEARDVAEIQKALGEYAAAHPGGADAPGFLVGRGWNYAQVGGLPHKRDLDAVVRERPVYLDGFDSHTAWVNSRALALAGITRHTADPPGGKIVRDEHGEPTGALQEAARLLVEGLLPRPTRAVRLVALRRGLALARQLGLTRVITCGDPAEDASDHAHLDLYEELQRAHQLTLRLYAAANVSPQRPLAGQLTALEALRRRYPPKGDWIATGAAKIFLDGVVEAHTAAMLAPYTDDPTTTGRLNWAPGPYKEAVRALDERRFQIFTHAIGDAAVRLALDAYGDAQTRNGRRDARHRIEHIETVAAADIPRFADLGVYASFQPLHARPDEDTLKVWLSRAGADRAQRAWAWQSIRRRGGQLAFGSDWPVVTLDPWQGLQSAVTRQMTNGQPAGGWIPSERLDVGAAIAGYTLGAAASIHRDGDEGSLRPGKLADLIIVSQDLFAIDPLHIGDTRVLLTMVGGEVVYTAPGPR